MSDRYTLHHGDCLEVMAGMEDNSIDTVITDPPYGLQFMGKDWDHGIPGERFWAEVLRVAKPGAMLLAFGGTRTFHRLACAIEDAGWIIRDDIAFLMSLDEKERAFFDSLDECQQQAFLDLFASQGLLLWSYGSGFPKSANISKLIDKRAGVEREVVGISKHSRLNSKTHNNNVGGNPHGDNGKVIITAPATDAARLWDGWGSALKPSFEPIIWATKPLTDVPIDSIIQETNVLIGVMLCLLLSKNVNDVERILQLNPVEQRVPSFAVMLVALLAGKKSGELLEKTAMFNSPETVKMCLNIATLWSNILGEVLSLGSKFTTKMGTEVITNLKTLNSLLSINIPDSITKAVCQVDGLQSNVPIAEEILNGANKNLNDIQKLFVAEIATWNTSKNGTLAHNAVNNLQQIIPSVNIVLQNVITSLGEKNKPNLSPSFEPIILAMKPLDGTFAENALRWGVAGLNIDGARVGTDEDTRRNARGGENGLNGTTTFKIRERFATDKPQPQGRWPANLILSDDPEVTAGFPVTPSSGRQGQSGNGHKTGLFNIGSIRQDTYYDSSSAARFFYCAKASKSERNHGLPDGMTNKHPTVKPVSLCQYLARLTKTPTGGIVLDPFCGSGSIGVAAILEGRQFIGIDQDADSVEVARYRLDAAVEETAVTQMELALNG